MVWVDLGLCGCGREEEEVGWGGERRWGQPPPREGGVEAVPSQASSQQGQKSDLCHLGFWYWPSLEWTVPLDEGAVFRRGISPKALALTLGASCLQDSQQLDSESFNLLTEKDGAVGPAQRPLRQWRHKASTMGFPHALWGGGMWWTATEKWQDCDEGTCPTKVTWSVRL